MKEMIFVELLEHLRIPQKDVSKLTNGLMKGSYQTLRKPVNYFHLNMSNKYNNMILLKNDKLGNTRKTVVNHYNKSNLNFKQEMHNKFKILDKNIPEIETKITEKPN